ncbi:hypothetical protein MalM25_03360 [Planctomycetes bacterium MalM25]|nr:hypothetical protein MalM25_03360 [Planctomycetes bacterium MalM25]
MSDVANQNQASPSHATGLSVVVPAVLLAGWMAFLAWLALA